MGYWQAGFAVTGVDLFEAYSRKRFPFNSVKSDAITYLTQFGHLFDVITASPPCQRYSITNAARRHPYPDLIGPTRQALIASGKPYVIENVAGSPLIDPIMLCGRQFGLQTRDDDGVMLHMDRHRLFESNLPIVAPPTCQPHDGSLQVAGSYGGARRDKHDARNVRHGGYVPSIAAQQRLLGIDWMTQKGMHQALPPIYTTWIGEQLLHMI